MEDSVNGTLNVKYTNVIKRFPLLIARFTCLLGKVYVGNLGNSASKHEIEGAFGKYGTLRNVWVARNPPGFAFVEFNDYRDAEDAVRALDGTRVCGTRIRVEMSSGRTRRSDEGSRGRGSGGGRREERRGRDRGRDRFEHESISNVANKFIYFENKVFEVF